MPDDLILPSLRTKRGVEIPPVVVRAIQKRFHSEATDILTRIEWDNLNGCFHFDWAGMYVGVEEDGYIHT